MPLIRGRVKCLGSGWYRAKKTPYSLVAKPYLTETASIYAGTCRESSPARADLRRQLNYYTQLSQTWVSTKSSILQLDTHRCDTDRQVGIAHPWRSVSCTAVEGTIKKKTSHHGRQPFFIFEKTSVKLFTSVFIFQKPEKKSVILRT